MCLFLFSIVYSFPQIPTIDSSNHRTIFVQVNYYIPIVENIPKNETILVNIDKVHVRNDHILNDTDKHPDLLILSSKTKKNLFVFSKNSKNKSIIYSPLYNMLLYEQDFQINQNLEQQISIDIDKYWITNFYIFLKKTDKKLIYFSRISLYNFLEFPTENEVLQIYQFRGLYDKYGILYQNKEVYFIYIVYSFKY